MEARTSLVPPCPTPIPEKDPCPSSARATVGHPTLPATYVRPQPAEWRRPILRAPAGRADPRPPARRRPARCRRMSSPPGRPRTGEPPPWALRPGRRPRDSPKRRVARRVPEAATRERPASRSSDRPTWARPGRHVPSRPRSRVDPRRPPDARCAPRLRSFRSAFRSRSPPPPPHRPASGWAAGNRSRGRGRRDPRRARG